jgi:helicase required for RNAi-mediated heterochromatin assembly 1
MGNMRNSMKKLSEIGLNSFEMEKNTHICVYRQVKINTIHFARGGGFVGISVSPVRKGYTKLPKINWHSTKRLMFGALVMLCTEDLKEIHFASVVERPEASYLKFKYERIGFVDLSIQLKKDVIKSNLFENLGRLQDKLILIETKNYFESYYHFLIGIQKIKDWNLPFKEYIIDADQTEIAPPEYISSKSIYKLDLCLSQKYLRTDNFVRVLSDWPNKIKNSLDDHQLKALKHALTKKIALIQGPPGRFIS